MVIEDDKKGEYDYSRNNKDIHEVESQDIFSYTNSKSSQQRIDSSLQKLTSIM